MTAQNSNRIYVAGLRGMVGGIDANNAYCIHQNLITSPCQLV